MIMHVHPSSLSTFVPPDLSCIRPVNHRGAARDDERIWLWFSRAMAMIRTLLDNPCPLMGFLCANCMSRPWCLWSLLCEACRCDRCDQYHIGLSPGGAVSPQTNRLTLGGIPCVHEAVFGMPNQEAKVCGCLEQVRGCSRSCK